MRISSILYFFFRFYAYDYVVPRRINFSFRCVLMTFHCSAKCFFYVILRDLIHSTKVGPASSKMILNTVWLLADQTNSRNRNYFILWCTVSWTEIESISGTFKVLIYNKIQPVCPKVSNAIRFLIKKSIIKNKPSVDHKFIKRIK